MLAINRIRYTQMGQPIGVDLNTVIELIKMFGTSEPKETIRKVMLLSEELIKHGD